jgi:hypothetical protein
MRLEISTTLDCPIDRVWQELNTSRLLLRIVHPLVVFEPLTPHRLPTTWEVGRYQVRIWMFGVWPMGKQWIDISYPLANYTPEVREFHLRDNGTGEVIKRWDHLIMLRELPNKQTHYTDQLEVEAGLLTPVIWSYAQMFYRHRQRNWRRLVQTDFVYSF